MDIPSSSWSTSSKSSSVPKDLGPEGGKKKGGHLVFEGTQEDMVKKGKGYTSEFLKKKLRYPSMGAAVTHQILLPLSSAFHKSWGIASSKNYQRGNSAVE